MLIPRRARRMPLGVTPPFVGDEYDLGADEGVSDAMFVPDRDAAAASGVPMPQSISEPVEPEPMVARGMYREGEPAGIGGLSVGQPLTRTATRRPIPPTAPMVDINVPAAGIPPEMRRAQPPDIENIAADVSEARPGTVMAPTGGVERPFGYSPEPPKKMHGKDSRWWDAIRMALYAGGNARGGPKEAVGAAAAGFAGGLANPQAVHNYEHENIVMPRYERQHEREVQEAQTEEQRRARRVQEANIEEDNRRQRQQMEWQHEDREETRKAKRQTERETAAFNEVKAAYSAKPPRAVNRQVVQGTNYESQAGQIPTKPPDKYLGKDRDEQNRIVSLFQRENGEVYGVPVKYQGTNEEIKGKVTGDKPNESEFSAMADAEINAEWTPEHREELIQGYANGAYLSQVAQEWNLPPDLEALAARNSEAAAMLIRAKQEARRRAVKRVEKDFADLKTKKEQAAREEYRKNKGQLR